MSLQEQPAVGIDIHGRLTFVNHAAEKYLGRTATELESAPLSDIVQGLDLLFSESSSSIISLALGNAQVVCPQTTLQSVCYLAIPVLEHEQIAGWLLLLLACPACSRLDTLVRLLSKVLQGANQSLVVSNLQGETRFVSEGFDHRFGYDLAGLNNAGGLQYLLTDPRMYQKWFECDVAPWAMQTELVTANGELHEAYVKVAGLRDAEGKPIARISIIDGLVAPQNHLLKRVSDGGDVTDLISTSRAQLMLNRIAEGVIGVDRRGRVDYLNPMAERLTGFTGQQASGRLLSEVFAIADEGGHQRIHDIVEPCLSQGIEVSSQHNCVVLRGDERELIVEYRASPVLGRQGRVSGAIVVFNDITERRSIEKQMAYQSSHDALTGLINRREFESRVSQSIVEARRHAKQFALIILDLDRFKVINDTCGHVAGDVLLKQVTALLYATMKEEYTFALGRLGGDEFGLLLQYCGIECARAVAERLCNAIQQFRFSWFERSYEVGASIGVSLINEHSRSLAEVLSAAESSCYLAKDHGRKRVHIYQSDDAELLQRRGEMQWLHRVQQALEKNQFCLYHQKILPLNTHNPMGAQSEVLVRMIDDHGKVVQPEAFIMAAERYQLMPEVDRWVIGNAFNILGQGDGRDRRGRNFYINLSGQTIGNENFLDFVVDKTRTSGIIPGQICFEITETAAIDNFSMAAQFIGELKEMGYRFALDDFGTGMSSYAYLKQLPVDYLKIDGSFVRDMVQDDTNHALVESINHMGHVMGIETIAEFVEDDVTLHRLWEIGVDHVQGFGVARPKPLWQSFGDTKH